METYKWFVLLGFILVPNIISIVVAFLTRKSVKNWLVNLNKPAFYPPSWIFGPAWGILYSMIGTSGFLIWIANDGFKMKDSFEWCVFFIQLLINYLWIVFFFGCHQMLLALFDIALLIFLIILNIVVFYHKSMISGLLLIPYLVWVSFATYLNYGIWSLNSEENNNLKMASE